MGRQKRLKSNVLQRGRNHKRGAGTERDEEGMENGGTKRPSEQEREGAEVFFCGVQRVTWVPIEEPAMTVPLENASYASGVALMEPESGCSCLPWRKDIVQLDKVS